jgi:NADH:ubiquinone oxidoreductase subunit E
MPSKESPSKNFNELEKYIGQFENKESALIKVLYEAQHLFGYLSKEVMLFISEKLDVPISKIYGVVSFYSYFTTEPRGRYQIKLCMGTACFVRGAEKIANQFQHELKLKIGETSGDRRFSLDALRCVGACGLAPVVMVNDKTFGKLEADDVTKLIRKYQG